jgi:hypothetical protein
MKMSGQFHAPAALSLGKESTLGGPLLRDGEGEIFAPAGKLAPTSQPVATHGIDWAIRKIVNGKNAVLLIM